MEREDELVVVRCQLGERAAFDDLVARWHGPLCAFLGRIGDPALVDDRAQEVWVRVLRGLPRLRDPGRFPAWFFTLARRTVVDDRRRTARQPARRPARDEAADDAAEATGAAVDRLAGAEDRLDVRDAMAALAPDDRVAVALFYLDDLSVQDVADVLGVPAGTVKSRLHRARRQLAAALDDEEAPR